MKRGLLLTVALCLAIGLSVGQAFSVETVEIQVAPHTMLLSSVQSGEVTVHVDIPYSLVVESTIFMNGIAVSWTKADDCGDLVAKFDEAAVKGVLELPSTTLTLSGTTTEGVDFAGSDTVKVKP